MRELSLNVLDIAQNSVAANATLCEIEVIESTRNKELLIGIYDNGKGMTKEQLVAVRDPFFTTRTTRKVGMGIPLLKFAAQMTGGDLKITSRHESEYADHGTTVTASFFKNHIDFTPLGDVISSITTLIQGHPNTDFRFLHKSESAEVAFDTREVRAVLEDVPLDNFEVLIWIKENLTEQYEVFNENQK